LFSSSERLLSINRTRESALTGHTYFSARLRKSVSNPIP
jgi:hypothetical protein